jgi:uncharacterized protein (TIGR03067 family)
VGCSSKPTEIPGGQEAVASKESVAEPAQEPAEMPSQDPGEAVGEEPLTVEQAEVSDARRILGAWRSVAYEKNGEQDPTGTGGKLVFTEDGVNLLGIPHVYEMDSSTTPKQLDFGSPELQSRNHAIYQFEDDKLTICFATTSRAPRPEKFATGPGDGHVLLVCERVPKVDESAPKADFDPTLHAALVRITRVLEEGDAEQFLTAILPPEAYEQLKASPDWQETVDYVASQRTANLNAFRAFPKLKPKFESGGKVAIFDLSQVDVEGVIQQEMRFVKVGEQWYVQEQ